jgi:hypothetical protein
MFKVLREKQHNFEITVRKTWDGIESYLYRLFQEQGTNFNIDETSKQIMKELERRGFKMSQNELENLKSFILKVKANPQPPQQSPRAPKAPSDFQQPSREERGHSEYFEDNIQILKAYLTRYGIDIMYPNLDFDRIAKEIEEEMYTEAIHRERSQGRQDFDIPFESRQAKMQQFASDFLFYQAQEYALRGKQQPPPRRRPQESQGIYEKALEMGFERALVRRALSQANGDEQVALDILLNGNLQEERPEEPIYNMGFDPALVRQALSQAKGNHEQAILDLVEGRVELLDEKLIASIHAMPTMIVAGNGNCLFLSLIGSLQNLFNHLKNPADYQKVPVNEQAMRKKIVDFERAHHAEAIFYQSTSVTVNPNQPDLQALEIHDPVKLNGREYRYQNLQKYFELMETNGAYATDVEIMTAAQIFGVTIYVEVEEGNYFVRYYSSNLQANDSRRAIYIIKGDAMGHYDWKDPYSKSGGKHKQGKKNKMTRSIRGRKSKMTKKK